MEIKWLEDFLCLSETQSFSHAAARRNVTQPAFSRRIKALELWLGAPLVDRSTYPTRLTDAGMTFRDTAEEILRVLYEVRDELRGAHRNAENTVSFTAQHSLALNFFPAWLRRIEAQLAPVSSRLMADNMHTCVQALVSGDCDFLICFAHPRVPVLVDPVRYPWLPLGAERLVLVSPPGEDGEPAYAPPGTADAPLPYLGYAPDSFLGRTIEVTLREQPRFCYLQRRYENSLAEALKAMAMEGHGVAWLPLESVRHELASGSLKRAGDEILDIPLEIRIYRSLTRRRSAADMIWSYLSAEAMRQVSTR